MSCVRKIIALARRAAVVIADYFYKEYFSYNWLLIVVFIISLCRYLSVDISRLIQPCFPDYGFLEYAAYNSFKRTEIIRYVLTCGTLFVLFVAVGLLKKKFDGKTYCTRTIRVTSMFAASIFNIAITYYNSHATTRIFIVLCAMCIGAIVFPQIISIVHSSQEKSSTKKPSI
jgi:hypothetical protein